MSIILKVLLPTSKGHFRVSNNQARALDLRLTQRPGGTRKWSTNILRNSPLVKILAKILLLLMFMEDTSGCRLATPNTKPKEIWPNESKIVLLMRSSRCGRDKVLNSLSWGIKSIWPDFLAVITITEAQCIMLAGDSWKNKYVPKTDKMFIQKRAKNSPLVRTYSKMELVHIKIHAVYTIPPFTEWSIISDTSHKQFSC